LNRTTAQSGAFGNTRQPKPYFKKSNNAWYANIGPNKRPVKLAEGMASEQAAFDKYHAQMAGRQPLANDCTVQNLTARLLAHLVSSKAPSTRRFYSDPLAYIGPKLRVADLKPGHVSEWVDRCHSTVKRTRKVRTAFPPLHGPAHGVHWPNHRPRVRLCDSRADCCCAPLRTRASARLDQQRFHGPNPGLPVLLTAPPFVHPGPKWDNLHVPCSPEGGTSTCLSEICRC
jgi:hypothetical protein